MFRRTKAASIAALLAATLGAAALAQENAELRRDPTPDVAENTTEGTVVDVDEEARTIELLLEEPLATDDQERIATFLIPEDAEIFIGGVNVSHAATIEDLNEGQNVEVAYEERDDGVLILIRLVG